ncbi:MAG: substrate-binding domain-containing protein [Candidatus Sulfotelmatobacter sp.]
MKATSTIAISTAMLLVLGLLLVSFPLVSSAQNGEVAVVVNSGNPVTNLSLVELRQIFAGGKHNWPGGLPIKLVVRTPGCHERLVLLRLLGMSETVYKQYWTGQVFRGEASSEPVAVFSNGFQREAIKVLPGAIGLMDLQDAKAGVKVIKLDGHLPGEAGYPLR